jgi:gliding motility-associated-like protein
MKNQCLKYSIHKNWIFRIFTFIDFTFSLTYTRGIRNRQINNKIWFLFGFIFLFAINTNSQTLNADFSSSITKGCSFVTVVFKNNSTPSTGLSYFWEFGNGANSNEANPIILFTEPGKYTVKLVVSDGVNSDSIIKQNYITVFKKPIPSFSTPSSKIGCVPLQINFQNNTILGDTTINIWHWDFGDGLVSSVQNPTHIFGHQANYSISLYVKDKNNCDNYITYDNYISAFKPVSSFKSSDSVSCNGILNTNFINQSVGVGELDYLWSFGDGTNSTQKDPGKSYTLPGIFNVSLITYDEHNCSDTITKPGFISIESVIAQFTTNKDTICANETIIFTNTSNNTSKCHWDFGDGSFSETVNPTHKYTAPGDYEIILTVTVEKGCSSIYKHKINVDNIVAAFSSSKNFGCDEVVVVNYIDNSTNAVQWDWRFGNNVKSDLKNPSNTYTAIGNYIDSLIVTSKHGCKNTKVVNPGVTIARPLAYFTPNNWVEINSLKGCTPLTVNFKDKCVYATNQDSIISWAWDFGDGQTSTAKSPSHSFAGTSSYQVFLEITTAKGCKAFYGATAKTGSKQNANFIKTGPDEICASTPVQFYDMSEDKNLVNEWYWIFGDGTTSTKQNPEHIFAKTGYMNVQLNSYYNGCGDAETKKWLIYIKGPIVNPGYTTTCSNHLLASFNSNSIAADNLYWNFGDGTPIVSGQETPTHLYNNRGNYKITLSATNNTTGCSFEAQKDVIIKDIDAVIDVDKNVGCPGAVISFDPQNSKDQNSFLYNGNTAKYLWDFGDGTKEFTSTAPILHKFNTKGTYNVKLKVKDFRGCEDSVVKQIKIHKPEPNFNADNYIGCMPMSVDFENLTKSDTAIASWNWQFGDNTSSSAENPVHIYTKHGLFNVSLTATDLLGCSTNISKSNYIEALKPFPDFNASDQTICIGDTIKFNCLATDIINSYLWNFGDGITSTLKEPLHVFSNKGKYNITLKLVDVQGCDSTKTVVDFIDIQEPAVVDFDTDETSTSCYPLVVHFEDKSVGSDINKWVWDFEENQSKSYIQNPIHTYTKPGIYDVSLEATTSYGCKSSIVKEDLIEIKGPWVRINAPDTICKNSLVMLSAEEKINVYDMQWFFNDGAVGVGDTVYHAYQNAGKLTPALLLISDDIHSCDKYFVDTLVMQELIASIYEYDNGQEGCVPFNKNFNDRSIGASKWSWIFGDGGNSKIQNPLYTFQNDGVFTTKLTVTNSFGCSDSTQANIVVNPLPIIKVTKDTLICLGQSIQLQASGGESYSWFPTEHLNSSDVFNPVSTPLKTTNYEVMGTDSNGCVNYARMDLAVQQIPEIKLRDTTIIIGEIVKLNAYSSDLLSYSWTPAYSLSSTNESVVYAQPLESTTYNITVVDTNRCFTVNKDINIKIRKEYTVDVPLAFTPNGDGINDKIFVRGWGVKDVIDFKVFNRFGELVFESHDKNVGWDGMYKGNNQNTETFTYHVKIITYEDEILTKTGTIKLIK